jgi:hypothetical protein
MKKGQIKLALLVILELGAMATVQAQTAFTYTGTPQANNEDDNATYNSDLILGFTATTGNDIEFDLGPASSLVSGDSWNLNSILGSFNLATVNWGVVDTSDISNTRLSYLTYNDAVNGDNLPTIGGGVGTWNAINTANRTIYNNAFTSAGVHNAATIAASSPDSWNSETVNPTLGTQYQNENVNPNMVGEGAVDFWVQNEATGTDSVLGQFTLSASGVVTYKTNAVVVIPPTPKIVSIVRTGGISTISFTTTNGAFTYTLYYTNSAGLTAPLTSWAASATTLVGNGNTNSLTDTTVATANRFYRIGVH